MNVGSRKRATTRSHLGVAPSCALTECWDGERCSSSKRIPLLAMTGTASNRFRRFIASK
jgi:hypothetical protein